MSTNNRPVWPWLLGGGLIFIFGLVLCCVLVGILLFAWNFMPMQGSSESGGPGYEVTVEVVPAKPVVSPSQQVQTTETPPPTTEPSPMVDPTATALAGEQPETSLSIFDQEGVSFSYPEDLASEIQSEVVAASSGTDVPLSNPAYLHLVLSGYPLSDTFHEPQVFVFPAVEFASMSEPAARIVQDLQALLVERSVDVEQLPFLPLWNAAQMMHSNLQYLDFENGTGVRYLTQYGQSFYPINNNEMFYTFQGLTADGQYYVVFVLPVSNPILPDPETIPLDDAFAQNFPTYLQETVNQLNEQPVSSFTPDLTYLDAVVKSLRINRLE